jgi:outer membrane protein OmpA-like peptidoglycan-associated protein
MRQAYLTCLLGSAAFVLTASLGATPTWSQAGPEMCRTVVDGNGDPVTDAAGQRVLTVASEPCPQPQVVAAVPPPPPEPAPAAGPIFTIEGDVAFDFDSDRIRPEFYPELDRIAAALRENPAEQLALVGHTDAIGTEQYNEGLSQRRAQSVAEYLQQAGVPSGRLVTSGAGENQPIATNETPEGRAQNRRVEISAV